MAMDPERPPLGTLGWRGRFQATDPSVVRLRATLEAEAGLGRRHLLDAVDPQSQNFAERAAALFHRDGFVLIKDCLDAQRLESLRSGCDEVIRHVVAADPQRRGNRDSHRYSFAGAAVQFGCVDRWACTVDCPPVLAVLTEIWGNCNFRCSGVGGDFVLPGAVEYQELHADGGLVWKMEGGATIDSRYMPPLLICVCFPMVVSPHSPDGHTAINGATRFIRGTATSHDPIPSLVQESRDMMLSTVAPVPAGWALIRDVRCWCVPSTALALATSRWSQVQARFTRWPVCNRHGGTPNVSADVRAIPASAFWAPWYTPSPGSPHTQLSGQGKGWLPREVWEQMSPHAKAVCAESVAENAREVAETTWWSPETDLPAAVVGATESPKSGPGSGQTVAVLPPAPSL